MILVGKANQLRRICERYLEGIPDDKKEECIEYVRRVHFITNETYKHALYNLSHIEVTINYWKGLHMTGNEYQRLAGRTINRNLTEYQIERHALHGMVGEIGEIHSLFQKEYQGHDIEIGHLQKEVGDLLWFIAEFCTVNDWNLEDIMQMNIDKLKARFPDGFEEEKSLHRREGDI